MFPSCITAARALIGVVVLAALASCSEKKKRSSSSEEESEPAPAALEAKAAEPGSACSSAGWERAELELTAHEAGTLEVEVVDRWDIDKDVARLMGPNDVRYLLASNMRQPLDAGESLRFTWSFGREPPSDTAAAGLCADLTSELSNLASAWQDPKMCTRESTHTSKSGSSSSLFASSCGQRSWRPHRLDRKGTLRAARGRWMWLSAWVWAPPDAKVELAADGSRWSYQVDGERHEPTTGPLPAWTLRAKLSSRKLEQARPVGPRPAASPAR